MRRSWRTRPLSWPTCGKPAGKRGIKYKAVVVIETKRMTNPHIHVVISRMDPEIIGEAWEERPQGRRGYQFQAPGPPGEPRQTGGLPDEGKPVHHGEVPGERESGESGTARPKTWTKPVITYKVVSASSWRQEPKARKGRGAV